jgi:predicted lipid-binding transport protein (Tim44 family)
MEGMRYFLFLIIGIFVLLILLIGVFVLLVFLIVGIVLGFVILWEIRNTPPRARGAPAFNLRTRRNVASPQANQGLTMKGDRKWAR